MKVVYASPCGEDGSPAVPRERIALNGLAWEADMDLLKAVLGSGSRENRVESISLRLLDYFDRLEREPKYGELTAVPGLGAAKSVQIAAAWEFCRRRMRPPAGALPEHSGQRRPRGNRDLCGVHQAGQPNPGIISR